MASMLGSRRHGRLSTSGEMHSELLEDVLLATQHTFELVFACILAWDSAEHANGLFQALS